MNPTDWSDNVTDAVIQQDLVPLGFTGADNYLDLVLMHFAGWHEGQAQPTCATGNSSVGAYYPCRIAVYKSFMEMRSKGIVRAIGVSNWEIRELQQL